MSAGRGPVEVEAVTVDCVCDHCKCSLNRYSKIWMWNEHFGCSRTHVKLAQAETDGIWELEYGANSESLNKATEEENDIDLL